MKRIEFYKMSIKEYPNHKDIGSLKISVEELQKEMDSLYKYIGEIEDNSEGTQYVDSKELIQDYELLSNSVKLGRTYLCNPKNCKGCINYNVCGALGGAYCSIVNDSVMSPNDMYKHPKCPVN